MCIWVSVLDVDTYEVGGKDRGGRKRKWEGDRERKEDEGEEGEMEGQREREKLEGENERT